MDERIEGERWPLRAWGLAVLGAGLAAAIHLLLRDGPAPSGRLALATLLGVGGVVFGFTVERSRAAGAAVFALVAGLVVASVIFWNGGPGNWNASDGWRIACAALAVVIAAPLFQAARREGRWRLPYPAVHDRMWTNVLLWCAAWLFVGIVWLLAVLLGALFDLIGIDLLRKALRQAAVGWVLTGAALGGAVGLLRERGGILALLQRVTRAVLGVLAPVLGAGLALFLLSLPFTGLSPLWDATKSTTPILLACVVGALILANAVIGDSPEDAASHPALRAGALVLAVVMLPLAAIAAVSVGLRIGQYGLTPSRLWALLFVAVACAWGAAYWVAVAWRRRAWPEVARPANLALAIGLCVLALLLSTPLVSFGALSTRDQVARLESGRIAPETFDWAALAFDFGPAGKRALARLKAAGQTDPIGAGATKALAAKNRWDLAREQRQAEAMVGLEQRVTILPRRVPLPHGLVEAAARTGDCSSKTDACLIHYVAGGSEAIMVRMPRRCATCAPVVAVLVHGPNGWTPAADASAPSPETDAARARRLRAAARGDVEIRTVERRQVFIGGEPVGDAFP